MCYLSVLLLGQYLIQALIHCVSLQTIYIVEKHIFSGYYCEHIMRLSNPWGRLRQSSIADHVTSATGGRKESGQEASTSFHCSSAPGDLRVPVGIDFGSKKLGPQRGVRPNGQNLVLFCKSILVFLPQSIPKGSLDTWFAHRDCLVLAATGSGMFSVMPFSIFCTLLFFPT
jgi:hypothetical protein